MSHQRGGANGLSKPLSSFSRALVFPEPFTICICYFSYVHLHSNLTLLWLPLAPFCPPLGSVWPPLAPLWLPFGSHGPPFWLPSALFGTKPLHYTTLFDIFSLHMAPFGPKNFHCMFSGRSPEFVLREVQQRTAAADRGY